LGPALNRWAWAEVDLAAVSANVARLVALVAPARVCAVVKADGYGHGAAPVARAALAGGAALLAVAAVDEGEELRTAGISAPVLLLAEAPPEAAGELVGHRIAATVYSAEAVDALAAAVAARPGAPPHPVHLKVDTGMHRVGCRPVDARGLAKHVLATPGLVLEGLMTHLAVADEPGHPHTDRQLEAFREVVTAVRGLGAAPAVHAANSAGAILRPDARFDLVRCGIATYGIEPAPGIGADLGLVPALSVHAVVTHVQALAAGEGVSYGLRHTFTAPAVVATVPLGYADGVPRSLGYVGGEVLVRGRRCPVVGTVTMDQLLVDATALDPPVARGDEVVLLGDAGPGADPPVTANEWAARLGTIGYEVVTRLGPRLPRRYPAVPGDRP
jgi:alanine racemase